MQPTDMESDAEMLKNKINKIKVESFDFMEFLVTVPIDSLPHYGYTTLSNALIETLKKRRMEIEKLIALHIKKYPND